MIALGEERKMKFMGSLSFILGMFWTFYDVIEFLQDWASFRT